MAAAFELPYLSIDRLLAQLNDRLLDYSLAPLLVGPMMTLPLCYHFRHKMAQGTPLLQTEWRKRH